MNASSVYDVPLDRITLDPQLEHREHMHEDVVEEYADRIKDGTKLPPVGLIALGPLASKQTVFLLWDGWHRVAAARLAGKKSIVASVIEGDRRDALLRAAGANAAHGLHRSRGDIAKAIRHLLEAPETREMTQEEIAKAVSTSQGYVSTVKQRLELEDESADDDIASDSPSKTVDVTPDEPVDDEPMTPEEWREAQEAAEAAEAEAKRARGLPAKKKDPLAGLSPTERDQEEHRGKIVHVQCPLCQGKGHINTAEGEEAQLQIPEKLDTPEFRAAYEEWIVYRKERKKSLTPRSVRTQLKQLAEHFTVDEAIERVQQAIASGWTGLVFKDDREAREASEDEDGHGTPMPEGQKAAILGRELQEAALAKYEAGEIDDELLNEIGKAASEADRQNDRVAAIEAVRAIYDL